LPGDNAEGVLLLEQFNELGGHIIVRLIDHQNANPGRPSSPASAKHHSEDSDEDHGDKERQNDSGFVFPENPDVF
jgi:hypothetical protein